MTRLIYSDLECELFQPITALPINALASSSTYLIIINNLLSRFSEEKMSEKINSHIQAPNFIIKNFIDEKSKKVFYIEVKTGNHGLCGTKKIGTAENWYSGKLESELNNSIETPFSSVCHRIQNLFKDETSIKISSKDDQIIKNFILTSIGRSDYILNSFKQNELLGNLNVQELHDKVVRLSMAVTNKHKSIFDDSTCGIMLNKTSKCFILPRNCFYSISDEKEEIMVMPIAPNICIGVFTNNYCLIHPSFKQERIVAITDEATVSYMNSCAFQYEYIMNGAFIVAPRRDVLEEAWNDNKDSIPKLDELRSFMTRCNER